ncbi:MAG: rubredoxin [Desulfovibrionaceae bacterium]|jgi:rubredoxin|nr:rubredoxin [Desulfovibrionaceae bacterium]
MYLICGWLYNEAEGAPEHNIAPGTPWDRAPASWFGSREDFDEIQKSAGDR